LTGPAEAIAEGLAAWRDVGVAEVMCRPEGSTPATAELIVRAKEILGD
jgi:hypothetical protein